MKRLRVDEQWKTYAARILVPAGVARGSTQYVETRRAFYAGATALLGLICESLTPGDEPQPEDLRMMDEIDSELRAFADLVGSGMA